MMHLIKRIQQTIIIASLTTSSIFAQNIGIGTTSPHPSAQLEIKANNQGLLIPRLTTTQRNSIPNPAHSLLIFNIDNFCIEVYDSISGQWLAVSCPISCPACDTIQCLTPTIDSISGPDTICSGDTVQYILHGSGGNAFIWNIPANWVMISQGQLATFIADSSGTIYGHLCNQCGCSSDSINVSVGFAPASVSVSGFSSICVLDTLTLVATSSGNVTYYSWQVPAGWTVIGLSNRDTLVAVPSSTGSFTFSVQACNGCGCSPAASHSVSVTSNALSPAVAIQGPSFVCLPDTVVFKAPSTSATQWQWTYPSSWQLIAQAGDSIVLVPDTADGNIIVQVCDTSACACDWDTLYITTDTCRTFCLAIGGSGDDRGFAIIQTNDGGYAIAGQTSSFGAGNGDVYVVKLNAAGNIQWTRTIGGSNLDIGKSIIQTSDGGYIIAGLTYSFGAVNSDVYIIKLDGSGNLQWTKIIGGSGFDEGYSIIQTTDKGYIVAGHTASFGAGGYDMYVIKLDSNGSLQWTRTIGGSDWDLGYVIIQTNDGGYIVAGQTKSYGVGAGGSYPDAYIAKLDSNGNLQWTRTVGGTLDDYVYSGVQTTDGGYILVGDTRSFGAGGYDAYIVKLDSNGNLEWTKTIGGGGWDHAVVILQTYDNGFLIVGNTESYGSGFRDVYLIKLDSNANLEWTKTIGGLDYEYGTNVIQTNDKGYAIVGYTQSFGSGGFDIYVVKLDQDGNLLSCPGGCQIGNGGFIGSGGTPGSGGVTGSGGNISTGGVVGSGGTLTSICP